jgi:hypothetical protein
MYRANVERPGSFFHPDCTVGSGVTPDLTLTTCEGLAGLGSLPHRRSGIGTSPYPAPKEILSSVEKDYSMDFLRVQLYTFSHIQIP